MTTTPEVDGLTQQLVSALKGLSVVDRISAINHVRRELHEVSPFKAEPVDCVLWVPNDIVVANNYNPNSVAAPEMTLLAHSIGVDGYTQPIVVSHLTGGDALEVVDGFHRHKVGKEVPSVRARILGYLPVVVINPDRTGVGDRMASTIRHNRARGKHSVTGMSDIVVELTRRGWSTEKIGQELGMDSDEVLRLKQVTGLAELFKDRDFSMAWEPRLVDR